MQAITVPRLKQVCNALPESRVDAQFRALSRLQRWLVLAVTGLLAVAVPPQLVDPAAQLPVATALVFIVLPVLSSLLARYNAQ